MIIVVTFALTGCNAELLLKPTPSDTPRYSYCPNCPVYPTTTEQHEAMLSAIDAALFNGDCNIMYAQAYSLLGSGGVYVYFDDSWDWSWGYTDFSSIYVNEYGMGDQRELGITLFHEAYHILNPSHTDTQAEAAAQACFPRP